MTIHTTNSIVNDTDESKRTSECGPLVEMDDSEPIITTRRQNWRTWWPDPADDGLYEVYPLVGVFCLAVIVFLVELFSYIKWLLN
jgi:hypothetical protein